eukprot:SAG31_NODE_720_length_12587_cov_15.393114_9_plen_83_part_00
MWVKVRGHSEAVPGKLEKRDQRDLTDAAFATIIGNDWADNAAGKGMAGKTKDVECVRAYADAYGIPDLTDDLHATKQPRHIQ